MTTTRGPRWMMKTAAGLLLGALLLVLAMILLNGCATLSPNTEQGSANDMRLVTGMEWTLAITDGLSALSCNGGGNSMQSPWKPAACMAYGATSYVMRNQIAGLKLKIQTNAPVAEVKAAIAQAKDTFTTIDAVYKGEPPAPAVTEPPPPPSAGRPSFLLGYFKASDPPRPPPMP